MTRRRPDRDPTPKYLRILLEGGWTPEPGELVTVEVLHDEDCAHRRGETCDCLPEVRLQPRPEPLPPGGPLDPREVDR
jgi:hypothetical protein